jgi:WD40 repeat protein
MVTLAPATAELAMNHPESPSSPTEQVSASTASVSPVSHSGSFMRMHTPCDEVWFDRLLAGRARRPRSRRTRRPLTTLPGPSRGVIAVALSADGQLVAGGGLEGPVWLWDTRTGRPVTTLRGHAGLVLQFPLVPWASQAATFVG